MKKFLLPLFFLSLLFSVCVNAETTEPTFHQANTEMNKFATGLSFLTGEGAFNTTFAGIINTLLLVVNSLFFIFMIYAGMIWFTSGGQEEQITKAKDIIFWCVIGMAVTLGSYALTAFILKVIGAS